MATLSIDSHPALLPTLGAAVPLLIAELAQLPADARDATVRAWARQAAQEVAHRGDALMFGGKKGAAAEVFNHLARGLAALAHQPGGVTFAGRHWCTDHAACEAAEAKAEQVIRDG